MNGLKENVYGVWESVSLKKHSSLRGLVGEEGGWKNSNWIWIFISLFEYIKGFLNNEMKIQIQLLFFHPPSSPTSPLNDECFSSETDSQTP